MFSQKVQYNQKVQECQSLRTELAQVQMAMPPRDISQERERATPSELDQRSPGSVPVNAEMTGPLPSLGAGGGGSVAPILKINGHGEFAGLLCHSPYSVVYEEELYPTAMHFFEARKFLDSRPDIADRIRECERIEDVSAISTELVKFRRWDWGNVGLSMVSNQLFLVSRRARVCWANLC